MIQKYKMMGLTAVACTLLGMGASEAVVTLTFAQVGPNVTATWSGSYLLPSPDILFGNGTPQSFLGPQEAVSFFGMIRQASNAGVPTLTAMANASGSMTGSSFGFSSTSLYFPDGASGEFSPVGTFTFSGVSLSDLGVLGFNNTLAFTGNGNTGGNQEIRFTTVPEPSTAFLAILGMLPLIRRRR